jgi:nickel/cobalt exporter
MRRFFILVGLFFIFTSVLTQNNPFVSKKQSKLEIKTKREAIRYPGFMQKFIRKIALLQRSLNKQLAMLTKKIKETKSKKTLSIIVFITFIYGIIHALGPGHGKTLTFSYFLSNKAHIKKGIFVGCTIGFLHAFSALVLVLILYFIIKNSTLQNVESMSRLMKMISYCLIALIGLFLIVKNVFNIKRKRAIEDKETGSLKSTKSIIPFSFAVGLIPCTGATIVLLFSLSLGVLKIGIISTISMALGMATTISTVGVFTIFTKESVIKLLSRKSKIGLVLQETLSIVGGCLIFSLGILLFLGVL